MVVTMGIVKWQVTAYEGQEDSFTLTATTELMAMAFTARSIIPSQHVTVNTPIDLFHCHAQAVINNDNTSQH